jgi:hypothetical protein
MQRRAKQATARAMASRAATEALVAPLVQLVRSADHANALVRLPRALELYERALVLAETTAPESTLLAASLLQQVIGRRMSLAAPATGGMVNIEPLYKAAWRSDQQLLLLSQRC